MYKEGARRERRISGSLNGTGRNLHLNTATFRMSGIENLYSAPDTAGGCICAARGKSSYSKTMSRSRRERYCVQRVAFIPDWIIIIIFTLGINRQNRLDQRLVVPSWSVFLHCFSEILQRETEYKIFQNPAIFSSYENNLGCSFRIQRGNNP